MYRPQDDGVRPTQQDTIEQELRTITEELRDCSTDIETLAEWRAQSMVQRAASLLGALAVIVRR